jgi:hypothetical protein
MVSGRQISVARLRQAILLRASFAGWDSRIA